MVAEAIVTKAAIIRGSRYAAKVEEQERAPQTPLRVLRSMSATA